MMTEGTHWPAAAHRGREQYSDGEGKKRTGIGCRIIVRTQKRQMTAIMMTAIDNNKRWPGKCQPQQPDQVLKNTSNNK